MVPFLGIASRVATWGCNPRRARCQSAKRGPDPSVAGELQEPTLDRREPSRPLRRLSPAARVLT
jgi:hypothetical protein